MGFKFRKSINLGGGFRINVSKSGVGYSWGVPGYRITKTARGTTRKTVYIPGTGISHVTESGKRKTKTYDTYSTYNSTVAPEKEIVSSSVESHRPPEYQDLLECIQKNLTLNIIANIFLAFSILSAYHIFFIFFPIFGLISKVLLATAFKIDLFYELDSDANQNYLEKMNAWMALGNCKKLWQITHKAKVIDKKYHAGASNNIKRIPFSIQKKKPFFISGNIIPILLTAKEGKIYIFPDKWLLINGTKVGVIEDDSSLRITCISTKTIEDPGVPSDATIAGYTWRYINKNGTPDRRFKNNPQLPICLYGEVTITTPNGLNIVVNSSSLSRTQEFADRLMRANS